MPNMSIYLERYSYGPRLINTSPPVDLKLIVVIPSYDEPELIETLESLRKCKSIEGKVEIIVVINHSTSDDEDLALRSQDALSTCADWAQGQPGDLSFYFTRQVLPSKRAGVGLARKIGMDEAVRRFEQVKHDGIIVCLDADCTCAPNYLQAIEEHFKQNSSSPGCSIYFEHHLDEAKEPNREAIASYELHLRYYVHGLMYGNLPAAFQTVGSAMAVRCSAYQKQGGMNKRKAGEDFYFLQRMIKLGGFTNLTATTVYPSSRISQRVPFGTGRAMIETTESPGKEYITYHPDTFNDLKSFILPLSSLYGAPGNAVLAVWRGLSPALKEFIPEEKYLEKIVEFNLKTSSKESFRKRFFHWVDGFFAFKFANHARQFYPPVKVSQAASWLLYEAYGLEVGSKVEELLMSYRLLDQRGKALGNHK